MTLDALRSVPPLTKDEMLDGFDDIVTDERITLETARHHLDRGDDSLLFGEYRVVTSAGSSGKIGIFVFDRQAWSELMAANTRMTLRHQLDEPLHLLTPSTTLAVAATSETHLSAQVLRDYDGRWVSVTECPVDRPLSEIIEVAQNLQPDVLSGYPSVLAALAHAQRVGRLSIQPRNINCSAEPLLEEQRTLMEEVWGTKIINVWAASEGGPLAVGCGYANGMHLSEDLFVIENVDEDYQPVPVGQPSAKVLVTCLYNRTQPLIRYELNDTITTLDEPCPCGLKLRKIEDIQNRADELFTYDEGVVVHNHNFRARLTKIGEQLVDYQIAQLRNGVEVRLILDGEVDRGALRNDFESILRTQGLHDPEVRILTDVEFERLPSGKLPRNLAIDTLRAD